jgi:hypothetical protein
MGGSAKSLNDDGSGGRLRTEGLAPAFRRQLIDLAVRVSRKAQQDILQIRERCGTSASLQLWTSEYSSAARRAPSKLPSLRVTFDPLPVATQFITLAAQALHFTVEVFVR